MKINDILCIISIWFILVNWFVPVFFGHLNLIWLVKCKTNYCCHCQKCWRKFSNIFAQIQCGYHLIIGVTQNMQSKSIIYMKVCRKTILLVLSNRTSIVIWLQIKQTYKQTRTDGIEWCSRKKTMQERKTIKIQGIILRHYPCWYQRAKCKDTKSDCVENTQHYRLTLRFFFASHFEIK